MATINLSFFSEILQAETEVNLLLPSSGEADCEQKIYPTLWLLHGGNGDCYEWLTQSSISRYADKHNLAVVLPSIYNSFGMDMDHGARYAAYLEDEIVAKIRMMFPCLSHDRDQNFVGGVSMGGFAALRWAMNRPNLFSLAGSFAGALDMSVIFERYLQGTQPGGPDFIYSFGRLERLKETKNDIFYMAHKNLQDGILIPKLYMICGEDDFGFDLNVAARDKLLNIGCNLTWKQVPGIHSFDCWDPYVPEFMEWLFSNRNAAEGGKPFCH